ncbi:MAG: ABC transporter ATP-binding protein [Candidatus Izemoplasmatales bacterium]|nr:ABC transporter ATP-binding protein [Candidatus Izemoplasmatales bacterium]
MLMKSENISIFTRNLTKSYSGDKGIFDLNLEFCNGGLNLVIGKNGSGKSTLLKCIMKLVKYSGEIEKRKLRIGYAPEIFIMPDFQTVEEFLVNIGRIKGLGKKVLIENSVDFFEFFNIEKYRNKMIRTLSNGTKQKVNLIQALIHEPKIIILDEPLVSLDFESQKRLLKYLTKLAKERLVIISTHNPEKFRSSLKRIYEIENGRVK